AGIRYKDRTDVLLVLLDPATTVAGVFTQSKCPSAPVDWCRAALKGRKARALVVNSGNANAFTGKTGRAACELTARIAGKAIGCRPHEIYLASTGVIGEPLDATKFDGVMEGLVAQAQNSEVQISETQISNGQSSKGLGPGWLDAARAIMTTDTFPK